MFRRQYPTIYSGLEFWTSLGSSHLRQILSNRYTSDRRRKTQLNGQLQFCINFCNERCLYFLLVVVEIDSQDQTSTVLQLPRDKARAGRVHPRSHLLDSYQGKLITARLSVVTAVLQIPDNSDVLSLISGRGGITSILDSACIMPKVRYTPPYNTSHNTMIITIVTIMNLAQGTGDIFVQNVFSAHRTNKRLRTAQTVCVHL